MHWSFFQRLLCVCLVFGLLLGISLPSYADVFDFSQEELEHGVFYSSNLPFNVYVDGVDIGNSDSVSTYGNIADKSNALKVKLGVYSVPLTWRTDEEFSPTASIGYSKLFSDQVVSSALSGKVANTIEDWETLMHGQFGYTIELFYGEPQSDTVLLKDSKITLDLSFPCKVYSGSGNSFTPAFSQYTGAFHTLYPNGTRFNWISSDINILNVVNSSYQYSAPPREQYKNIVTVGYISSSSSTENVIATYESTDTLNQVFTLPEDASSVYVDVEYSPYSGSVYEEFNLDPNMFIYFLPSMYSFDVSGSVEIDTTGQTTGLIKSVIEWLKNILNAIKSLPLQIATFILEGIESLFVPSSENLMSVFDQLKQTAESKLGFLYSIFQMVYDLFNSLTSGLTQPMETLTIPRFALPFPGVDGGLLLWEEMTFDIMPQGLAVLRDLVKLLTSLVLITATFSHCIDYFRGFFKKE